MELSIRQEFMIQLQLDDSVLEMGVYCTQHSNGKGRTQIKDKKLNYQLVTQISSSRGQLISRALFKHRAYMYGFIIHVSTTTKYNTLVTSGLLPYIPLEAFTDIKINGWGGGEMSDN